MVHIVLENGKRLLFLFFIIIRFNPCFLQIYTYQGKQAHVNISYKYQRETGNQITPPIVEEQLITGNKKHDYGYIMAKTVLAGKYIKKLPAGCCFCLLRALYAIFPRFPENFFVGNCPCNAGYGDGQDKQPGNLNA